MCIKCGSYFDACPEKFDPVKIITGAPAPPLIPEDQRVVVRNGCPLCQNSCRLS